MAVGRRHTLFVGVVAVVGGLILFTGLSVVAVLLTALGTLIVGFGVMALRVYLRIHRADPIDVADVSAGMTGVALTGTARPAGATTTSPFMREDTLVSRSAVFAPGGNGSNWVEVETIERYEPFVLEDGTGEVFVDPNGAMWNFETDTWTVEAGEEPPRPIREFIDERDSSLNATSEVIHERDRKFGESRLDPGEDVYVYGSLKHGPAEDAPRRTVTPYVGSDRVDETDGSYVKNRLSWRLLPGVGGDPNESEFFTVADARGRGAPRRFLVLSAFVSAIGLSSILMGVLFQLGVLEMPY